MTSSKSYAGDTLIVANPGTGKTTALANRVVELLKDGAKEEDMLCITFTEKAASEMRERVASAVKDAKLRDVSVARIPIHTFHSYANSYLEGIGESKEIVGNNFIRYSIFRSYMKDKALNYGKEYIISDIVPKSENAIRYLKSFGVLPKAIDITKARRELEQIYNEEEITNVTLEENMKFMDYFLSAFSAYEEEKDRSKGLMDYNDMLIRFIKRYDSKSKRYKFVMVDELQDMNEIEAEIAIASGDSLFLVGDRKQAIFGFQGGSTGNFSNFAKRNGMRKETKTVNYRSLQGVLDYSKAHFLKHTADKSHEDELSGLKGNRKGRAKVSVITAKGKEAAAVSKLMDLVGEQKESQRRIAIITRTNGQIVEMSRMLDGKGIDFATTAGGSTNDKAKEEIIAYIKGILYDDGDSIINALFTPFSGVTLKESFEVSEAFAKDEKEGMAAALKAGKAFFVEKEGFTIDRLPDLFLKKIIPISVSIGKEYYLTATSIYRSTDEFFRIVSRPDRDSFFDYLSITEEDYEPIGGEKPVTLTTVHKAKGREFDVVIYLPRDNRDKVSFIDAVVYAIVKASKGIDIREELEEEHLRVDFVAFTRAKDELYIIASDKQRERYLLNGMCDSESYESDLAKEPESWKYDQAYAMFVSGRRDAAASAITNREIWLREVINGYFSKLHRLSYTMVDEMNDPYAFLKGYILGLGELRGEGLRIGTAVHEIAESMFKEGAVPASVPERYLPYVDNIRKVRETIEKRYKGRQIAAELSITRDLTSLFGGGTGTGLEFKAKIDAVYETSGGPKRYLILDYKTDKTNERASEHRRQLAVYKRVYAREKDIREDEIGIAIGFIGLRGKVNTGVVGWELDDADSKAIQISTFEKRLSACLAYKKNPEQFIADLLDGESDEPLYGRLTRELEASE